MHFKGIIKTIGPAGKYGFIDIASVTQSDGSAVNMETDQDIFLHSDMLDEMPLQVGMQVFFKIAVDTKRENAFRAVEVEETPKSALTRLGEGGIKLTVQGQGGSSVLTSSLVFAAWCVSPKLAPQLRKLRLEGKVMRLLFIHWKRPEIEDQANHPFYQEKRLLVDPFDPMVPLGFTAPGTHRVLALLVAGNTLNDLKDRYLARKDNRYNNHVISHAGNSLLIKEDVVESGYVEVEIPDGLFAKRPRDWGWVTALISKEPEDQCALRKRRFFAYTLQPVVMLLMFVIAAAFVSVSWLSMLGWVVLLLCFGFYRLDYSALKSIPDASHDYDIVNGRTLLVPKIMGTSMPLPLIFSPIVIGVVWTIGQLAYRGNFQIPYLWVAGVWGLFSILLWTIVSSVRRGAKVTLRPVPAAVVEEELNQLFCDGSQPRLAVPWHLSREPSNFRFFFLGAKQRVCKFYAK